jgi:coenzyme Q-binding protein COQ10
MSRTRDELCEQAAQRIKGGISPESFDEFASIFRRYADADSQLDYRGFCCACGELGEVYQDFKDIRENSVISGAVFSTLETSERPHKDWLSLDDFVVGVYMMTKGTFEQKAHNLFHLIDSTGDGKISREELTRALRRRVETVRKIFPTLLRDQVQIQLELVQEQEGIDKAQLSAKSSQDAAIEKGVHALDALMVEIEAEIPLAVNQIFLEADLDQDDFIKEEEWLLAWQAHPEFVELLSIDGLKKVAQWAAVVRGGGDAPTGDDDSEDPSSIPDTRLTYVD